LLPLALPASRFGSAVHHASGAWAEPFVTAGRQLRAGIFLLYKKQKSPQQRGDFCFCIALFSAFYKSLCKARKHWHKKTTRALVEKHTWFGGKPR